MAGAWVATTAAGGAGALSVSGAPSGGVSAAAALVGCGAADDVGSVIDFLSGAVATFGLVDTPIALRPDQQIYSTQVASIRARCGGVRFDGCAAKRTLSSRSKGTFRRLGGKTYGWAVAFPVAINQRAEFLPSHERSTSRRRRQFEQRRCRRPAERRCARQQACRAGWGRVP